MTPKTMIPENIPIEELRRELHLREGRLAIATIAPSGSDELSGEHLLKFTSIMEHKTGIPVNIDSGWNLRLIYELRDLERIKVIGFELRVGGRSARQAVEYTDKTGRDKAVLILAEFFRNPDDRLAVDGEFLSGNLLAILA